MLMVCLYVCVVDIAHHAKKTSSLGYRRRIY